MGFIGIKHLQDNIYFTVNTHDPTSGAANDADSPPTFRVYEQNTGTPLVTGTMSLFDSANTVGFYIGSFNANYQTGFENNKVYNIYISSTVNSVIGTDTYQLQLGSADFVDVNSRVASMNVFTYTEVTSGSIYNLSVNDGQILQLSAVSDESNMAYFAFDYRLNDTPLLLTVRGRKTGDEDIILSVWDGSEYVNAITLTGTMVNHLVYLTPDNFENLPATGLIYMHKDGSGYGVAEIDYMVLRVLRAFDPILDKLYPEPVQEAPVAKSSAANAINYIYKAWRNKVNQTDTEYRLFNDNDSTIGHKSVVSDNGSIFTRGKMISG